MRRLAIAALLIGILPPPAKCEVRVEVDGDGQVRLEAKAAPLTLVLDQLAEKTGMEIDYEKKPTQTVTAELSGRTAVQAVLAILEGQGLNYALSMDQEGRRVEKLLILGEASAAAPASASGRASPSPRSRRARSVRPEPEVREPEPTVEEPPPPEEAAPIPTAASPGLGFRSSFPRSAFTPGLPATVPPSPDDTEAGTAGAGPPQ
jgi:hypothetical protein